jgi:hypothetical protein
MLKVSYFMTLFQVHRLYSEPLNWLCDVIYLGVLICFMTPFQVHRLHNTE